ncbi:MAG TPA: GNAT family N-acetyltransferase [Micromonosporaceae bacterium]|nr:GNAT family N-acetyltransferase [Micromonosporaceae bacterium]
MTWLTTDDAGEFLATAGPFLASRPVEHTLLLTVAETVRTRGRRAFGDADPLFGWWRSAGGDVGSAFLQTPPHPLLLSQAPDDAVTALAAMLAAAGRRLPAVNSTVAVAQLFAAEWRRHTAVTTEAGRRSRLYRLGTLVPPGPAVPGRSRVASEADRDLLLDWHEAFGREVGEASPTIAGQVDDRLGYGGLTLWEAHGAPVAMAGRTRQLAGVVRVAPVYTPAVLRGRGYGGAVTAAVSQAALDMGASAVVLFTDLANPTSNALYTRLGYRPVQDQVMLAFTA